MMAQDNSEANSNRIITAFTIMSARINMETKEKCPDSTSLGPAEPEEPGGAVRFWDSAAGPTGAAMGGAFCAQASEWETKTIAVRIKKAAARILIIEKPFGALTQIMGA